MSANNNKQLKVVKRNIKGKDQYDLIYTNTRGDIRRVPGIPPTGFEAIVIPVFQLSDMSRNQRSDRGIGQNHDEESSSDDNDPHDMNFHVNSAATATSSIHSRNKNSIDLIGKNISRDKKSPRESIDEYYDAVSSPRSSQQSGPKSINRTGSKQNADQLQMMKLNNKPDRTKLIDVESLTLVAKAIQGVEEIQQGIQHLQDTIDLPWDTVHQSKKHQNNTTIADVTGELNNTADALLCKLSNLMAYIKNEIKSEEVDVLTAASDKVLKNNNSRSHTPRNKNNVGNKPSIPAASPIGLVQSDLAEIKSQVKQLCGLLNNNTSAPRHVDNDERSQPRNIMHKTQDIKQALDRITTNLMNNPYGNQQNNNHGSHNQSTSDKYNLNKTVAFADKTVKKVHPDYTSTLSETMKSTAANSRYKESKHSSIKEVTERNELINRTGQSQPEKNYFKLNNKYTTDTQLFDEGREQLTQSVGVVTHTIREEHPQLTEVLRNVHKTQINDVVNKVGHTSNTNETIMTTEIHQPVGQKNAEKTYTTIHSRRMFHENSDTGNVINNQGSKKKKNLPQIMPPDDSDDDDDSNRKPSSSRRPAMLPINPSNAISQSSKSENQKSRMQQTKSSQEKTQDYQSEQQRKMQPKQSKTEQRTNSTQTLDSKTNPRLHKSSSSKVKQKNKSSLTSTKRQVKSSSSQTPPVKKKSLKKPSIVKPSDSCVLYRIPPEESDTTSKASSDKYKNSSASLKPMKSPLNNKNSKSSTLRHSKRSHDKSKRIKSPAHKRIRYDKELEQSSNNESTDEVSIKSSTLSSTNSKKLNAKSTKSKSNGQSRTKPSNKPANIKDIRQSSLIKLTEVNNKPYGEEAIIKTQKYDSKGSSTLQATNQSEMEPNLSKNKNRTDTKSNLDEEITINPDNTIIRKNIKLIAGDRELEDIIIAIVPEENPKDKIKIFNIDVLCRENYVVLGKFWSSEQELRRAKQVGVFSDIFTIYVINSPEAAASTTLDDDNSFESESYETVIPNPKYDENNECYYQNIATETLQTLHNIYVDRFEAATKVIRVAIEENMQIIATLNQDMEEPEYALDFYTKDCDLIGTLYLPADDFQVILERSDIEVNDYENILLNDENVAVNPSNEKDRQGILEEFGTHMMGPFLDDSILTAIDRMIFCLNYIGDCFSLKKY